MQSLLLSAALQTKLTADLCHCKYTYGYLLFIQVCSDISPRQCSTVQGKMQSPLLSAALQTQLTAGLCHCKYTYGYLLLIQVCSDISPRQCSTVQGKMQSPLLSAALQTKLTAGLCHCKYTYGYLLLIQVCSDISPRHCSSVQGKMQSPLLSAALQTQLTAGLCHCKYTCGFVLLIQVCSDISPRQCSTVQGKMQSPLLSTALQTKLTAGLCHCKYTCGFVLFTQVCSEHFTKAMQHCSRQNAVPTAQYGSANQADSRLVSCVTANTPVDLCSSHRCAVNISPRQCSTVQGKMQSPLLSAALQTKLTAGLCHCKYTYGYLLLIQVCSEHFTKAMQHCSRQNAVPTAQCCSANPADSRLVSLQIHLWIFAVDTGVQ